MNKEHIIKSYGRRKVRGLSTLQKTNLVDLYGMYGIQQADTISKPHVFFDNKFSDIIIEIGFGNGEHLINRAIEEPNYGFIGCETFENGVANTLNKIHKNQLQNVRIYNGDARFFLNFISNCSIRRFYILFPDPWPKKKHHKRRLLSEDFIKTIQDKLIEAGDVVLATDSEHYMSNILASIENNSNIILSCKDGKDVLQKSSSSFYTKYEGKALLRGDRIYYMEFEKKY